MKNVITILFLLAALRCCAQLTEDKSLEKQYNLAFKKLPSMFLKALKEPGAENEFQAVVVQYQVDTLNKAQFILRQDAVRVSNVNAEDEEDTLEESISLPLPWMANGKLKGDTLQIFTGIMPNSASTKVFKSKATTIWHDDKGGDKVFRLNLIDKRSANLNAPALNPALTLSNTYPKVGETIYGKLTFTTVPYYQDNPDFSTGYIYQKVHVSCYFKIKVK